MRRMSGVEPYPIVVASQIGRSTLWTSRVTAPQSLTAQPVRLRKTREVSRAQRPRGTGDSIQQI
jgi:hypothetical protein